MFFWGTLLTKQHDDNDHALVYIATTEELIRKVKEIILTINLTQLSIVKIYFGLFCSSNS